MAEIFERAVDISLEKKDPKRKRERRLERQRAKAAPRPQSRPGCMVTNATMRFKWNFELAKRPGTEAGNQLIRENLEELRDRFREVRHYPRSANKLSPHVKALNTQKSSKLLIRGYYD